MNNENKGEQGEQFAEDGFLWGKMKAGDRQALAALFRRYYATLYDYAMKLAGKDELARDSIQEIFLYLWDKRKTIAPAQSVRAYLLVILRRQLLKALEKERATVFSNGDPILKENPQAFSPEDMLIMQEQQEAEKRALAEALRSIPPRMREALYLKTYDGLRYREIAEIMDISPQVARNYVSEAYHRLSVITKSRGLLSH